jgi:hypothetical protein
VLSRGGIFEKIGGTIYGSDAPADLANKTTGATDRGRAVATAVTTGVYRKRETTAGPDVYINSASGEGLPD